MRRKIIDRKLEHSEEERGVSPVIGVILMVAITVILAAVIATLVMDFGQGTEEPINSNVDAEVESNQVKLSVVAEGEAEGYVLRGAGMDSEYELGSSLSPGTGSTHTITMGASAISTPGGTVNIIATAGDREDQAGSFEVPENWASDMVTVETNEPDDSTIEINTRTDSGSIAATVADVETLEIEDPDGTVHQVPYSSGATGAIEWGGSSWSGSQITVSAYDDSGQVGTSVNIDISEP